MADEPVNNSPDEGENTGEEPVKKTPPENPDIDKLVEERAAEKLKDVKSKLDKAYNARDEALKKLAEIEQRDKEAEMKRLQEEGKFKEAYEMQAAEMKAKLEAIEKRNVELTRDLDVKNVLNGYTFRNEKAIDMAFREITDQLIRAEDGSWIHRSGLSIKDAVKAFADNEDNSFLFKQKQSSGAGGASPKPGSTSDTAKSVFAMSQAEVLKLAAEGKLRRPQ